MAHTANHDNRDTWYSGDGKASSLIDYIAGPKDLSVFKSGQLANLGFLLQPVDINRRVDHMPIFICFAIGTNKSKFTPLKPQGWNQDSMMECLNTGKLRLELIRDAEECCRTFLERHPGVLDQHTPDDLTETLMTELVETAQKHFHKTNKGRSTHYETARQVQLSLLQQRGQLKQTIQDIPNNTTPSPEAHPDQQKLLQIQQDLKQITKMLEKARKEQWHITQTTLNDEIHEAWGRRDMKLVTHYNDD